MHMVATEYAVFDAQDFAKANGEELGVTPVPSLNLVCAPQYEPRSSSRASFERCGSHAQVCSGDDSSFEYITADVAKEKGLEVRRSPLSPRGLGTWVGPRRENLPPPSLPHSTGEEATTQYRHEVLHATILESPCVGRMHR